MQTRAIVFFAIIAAILACGTNERSCGTQCYDPTSTVCVVDQYLNTPVLCPTGNQACNKGCFLPASYHCVNGQLQGGPATTSSGNAANAKAQTTSSTKVAASTTKATTSSTAVKAQTTSTTKAPTPSTTSTTKVATSSAAASTSAAAASTSAAAATSSCDPSGCGSGYCNCNGGCYKPGDYNCPIDLVTGLKQLCQLNFASCKGNCFDSTQASCISGSIVPNGANGGGTPASSTYPPPVVPPAPAPANRPTQTADLRVINSCKTTLWVEGRYGGQGAPIPGQSQTSLPVGPGGYVDYTVPDSGLGGTRFWAKYGCDAYGKNCLIGDAMQYWPNPPGGCPAGGCTPPVDSLFEATWGCRPGSSCNTQNPTTWFDTSQVDGWTIPYKLTPNGDTSGCDCAGNPTVCGFKGVDASRLDLAKCPSSENLVAGGQTSVNVLGTTVPLNSVDLRIIKNNSVIGCMSPCKRLNWGVPYGLQQDESSGSALWMCCPTPNPDNCLTSQGCVTSAACRTGPIENTQFVAAVHTMAPGVYSYSYDDGVGLHACPAGVVTYTMEFCPSGSTQYPLPL